MNLSASSGTVKIGTPATITVSGSNYGTLSCTSSAPAKATCSVSGTTVTITPVAVGTSTITVTGAGSSNYNSVSKTYAATIETGYSCPFGGTLTVDSTKTNSFVSDNNICVVDMTDAKALGYRYCSAIGNDKGYSGKVFEVYSGNEYTGKCYSPAFPFYMYSSEQSDTSVASDKLAYSSKFKNGNPHIFVDTTFDINGNIAGHHVCLREKLDYNDHRTRDKLFCIDHSYWYTDAATTADRVVADLKKHGYSSAKVISASGNNVTVTADGSISEIFHVNITKNSYVSIQNIYSGSQSCSMSNGAVRCYPY